MTGTDDLDPRLSDWLVDGPSKAPDRAISVAVDHARAHPRRRDLLAFIRTDPMGSGRSVSGLRPLPLVAALGLLAVASLAVATVGGLFDARPVFVPQPLIVPSASPSSVTSASPTAAPSTPPTPSPTATVSIGLVHVDLLDHDGGHGASIDITDRSGTLVKAESGVPGDGGSVEDGTVLAATLPGSPNVLVLTWSGSPCDTTHALTISADGRDIAIQRRACSGDAIPVDHVLQLTFDHTIDLTGIHATITTLP